LSAWLQIFAVNKTLKVEAYKLYRSRKKATKLLLVSSIFVALGISFLTRPDSSKFGAWSCILFFGIGLVGALVQILDRRPKIIITERGIFDRITHNDFIEWDIIRDGYLINAHRERMLCLVVDESFVPSGWKGKVRRKMPGLAKAIALRDLCINVGNVEANPEELVKLILSMRTADQSKRSALIKKALANTA
jgi:hypothetical protein